MKLSKVFIGNIYQCTHYALQPFYLNEERGSVVALGGISKCCEIVKKDAMVVPIGHGKWIDLDDVKSDFDFLRVQLFPRSYRGILMETHPSKEGDYFVEGHERLPIENRNVPLWQLKLVYRACQKRRGE